MTDDLVKCLRDSCYLAFDDGTNDYGTAEEAADRIEKLEALVEQLRNDNSYMIDDYDTDFLRQEKRIEKLEAALQRANAKVEEYERKFYLGTDRIEKLEEALRDCMEMAEVHEIPFRDRVMYISDIARKSLEGKDD